MKVYREAQPAVSQTSWRETPSNRALEEATPLVKWALIRRGKGKLRASYAEEIASTIYLLIVCLDAGDPFLTRNTQAVGSTLCSFPLSADTWPMVEDEKLEE